ncbi:MAG TPA: cysteine desulfurase family protein [Candidatus Saccharimonadales bacterium]|nr:cysteine desulfurase family protein [Candidatus Saccharimonadales bacterium]
MRNIYLDYAAAAPVDPAVLKAMRPYFSDKFYNPSATYLAARAVRHDLAEIRHQVASTLGTRPVEIVFTAGATEANNLAIQGVMRRFPQNEVLVSAIEHESVLEPARLFKNREIPVTAQGIVDLAKLEKMIRPTTVLVSVMLVNNELGTVQPLGDIARIINRLRIERKAGGNKLPLYLHSDAAQAGNYLDLHTGRLGVDLMSLNGGKIYGPKQSGVLYVKAGTEVLPLIVGGGQEFGLRSGTENMAAAAGFAAALRAAQQKRATEAARVLELRRYFERELTSKLPHTVTNGAKDRRAPHLVSVTLPGQDNERLMMELDERGIQCAVGSACSASRDEASHVLSAIGLSAANARSTLRFSLGRFTTKPELTRTVKILAELTDNK